MTTPPMDWNAWFGNSDQRRQEYDAAWSRVSDYYNKFSQELSPAPTYVPAQQSLPAHQAWEDEDLVGSAMYWGLPEHAARQMPRDALIHFVNQQRDNSRKGGSTGLAMALAPLAQFGVGAGEAVTGALQKIPLLGDWLYQGGVVHDADMYLRKLEEGVRASTPQGEQSLESVANVTGGFAALWYPGTASWAVAGKVGKIVPLVSRASPIGRAAIQGGLAAYILEGGTHDASAETGATATQNPWEHRAEVVGTGALLAGGIQAVGPLVGRAAKRVMRAFSGADGDLLQAGDLGGIGSPPEARVVGSGAPPGVDLPPDLIELANSGDTQAQFLVEQLYGKPMAPPSREGDILPGGGGLPGRGMGRGPDNSPRVGRGLYPPTDASIPTGGSTYYHGTGSDFDQINTPAFLTSDPTGAAGYATGRSGYPVVREAQVNLKNPAPPDVVRKLGNEMFGYDDPTGNDYLADADPDAQSAILARLKGLGYDGAHLMDVDRFTGKSIPSVVVLDPAAMETSPFVREHPFGGPEVGLGRGATNTPRVGNAEEADALASQMNKAGTIIQSPAFPEISTHTVIDEVSVARAAHADNPGGINLVQGVVEPPKMMQQFGGDATFVSRHGRLDVLVSDTPLPPKAQGEYEQFGIFTGQRVSTAEGITGTVQGITYNGEAYIEPEFAGSTISRQVDELHPSLESPQVQEAPPLWEAFQSFLDQKAAETQAALGGALDERMIGIVKSKNMAQWMEAFFNDLGINSAGDRDRLRGYFNKRWVDSFKNLAPLENASQQTATADLNRAVNANPLQPIAQLDAHAQSKGFLAVPEPGGKWTLRTLDVPTTGQSGTQLSFPDRESAETWVKQINRDVQDVTPSDGEVPTELTALHPTQAMTPPNINAETGPALTAAVKEAEALTGGPPAGEPPAEVHQASGNYGRNQSRLQQALSRWAPLRAVFAKVDEVMLHITGKDYGIARDYDGLSHMLNLYHTDMRPYHDELANLLAPVKVHRMVSGEWSQVYETLDPVERTGLTRRLGWSPAEVESLDHFDQLMQRLFPETGLNEIREIPRYFSHIATRQSSPELFPRAFEDFHLGKTTTPFYQYARTGNLNFRELDPRTVGDIYIRAVMWDKHMADTYNLLRDKWDRIATDDPVIKDTAANFMGSYLDIVKGGYHADDDLALDTMHLALRKLVDPAITRQEARELILGGINSTYAGLIGYRPNMIARHFLQMTYAIPRVGADLPRVLLQFMRSGAARKAILDEAMADGAISPRVYTRNAPGAFVGELERVGTGSTATGPGGPIEPIEHSSRYKAIAAVHNAVVDAMPEGLKGQEDSILRPMGAFSKAVERFQSIVYVAGKQRAARALAEFRAAGPAGSLDQLMGDSMARTFDPAWQREFKGMVASGPGMDEEAAKFMGRQLRDATFFKYGVAESPWVTKSVTGKVGLQLGHYSLNYLQFLRESLTNGTTADKAKLFLTFGATTAGLEAASRETGWNLRWLNPYLAFVPGAGPMVGMAVALASGAKHGVDAIRDNDAAAGQRALGDLEHVGQQATNMLPFSGLAKGYQAGQEVAQSPIPFLTAADYALTGHVGSEPEQNRALLPQAEAEFQQSLQPLQSPVRAGGYGLPQGAPPQQPVTDPALMQNPSQIPSTTPGPGSTGVGANVSPGAVQSVPTIYPQFIRR